MQPDSEKKILGKDRTDTTPLQSVICPAAYELAQKLNRLKYLAGIWEADRRRR